MGALSKKLFKKASSVPHDKAVKVGVEAYKKEREKDINRARFDMIVIFLTFLTRRSRMNVDWEFIAVIFCMTIIILFAT